MRTAVKRERLNVGGIERPANHIVYGGAFECVLPTIPFIRAQRRRRSNVILFHNVVCQEEVQVIACCEVPLGAFSSKRKTSFAIPIHRKGEVILNCVR
jgi:hypothetical protein